MPIDLPDPFFVLATQNPIEQEGAGGCTPMDYFVRVLSGSKTWSPV